MRLITPAAFHASLPASARKELASPCWKSGRFLSNGEIDCPTPFGSRGLLQHPDCRLEYLCETMAMYILMPRSGFVPKLVPVPKLP